MSEPVYAKEMLRLLREDIERTGGVEAWCKQHRLSTQYIHELLRYRKTISPKIARCLGYDRRIVG